MSPIPFPRLIGLLGIGWFALFLVGAVMLQGEPPPNDAPISQVREYFRDHGGRYLVGDFLAGCAFALLLLPFAAMLPRALSVPNRLSPVWSHLTISGAAALVAVGGTATSFLDAVAMTRGDPRLDDSTLTALLYANSATIALIGLPTAVFATAAATLVWHSSAPRAIAVLGWVAAAFLVLGAAFPIDTDARGPLWTVRFFSFLDFPAFILATSVTLLTRPPRPT
jgi:hypothetical protein